MHIFCGIVVVGCVTVYAAMGEVCGGWWRHGDAYGAGSNQGECLVISSVSRFALLGSMDEVGVAGYKGGAG